MRVTTFVVPMSIATRTVESATRSSTRARSDYVLPWPCARLPTRAHGRSQVARGVRPRAPAKDRGAAGGLRHLIDEHGRESADVGPREFPVDAPIARTARDEVLHHGLYGRSAPQSVVERCHTPPPLRSHGILRPAGYLGKPSTTRSDGG